MIQSSAALQKVHTQSRSSSQDTKHALKDLNECRSEALTFFNSQSMLFLAAANAVQPSVRAAAVGALRGMMEGIPLKKWLSSGNNKVRA